MTDKKPKHSRNISQLARDIKAAGATLTKDSEDADVKEFLEKLDKYAESLFVGRFHVKNTHKREELKQEAFLNAIKGFKGFDPEKKEYSGVFFTICLRTISSDYKQSHTLRRKPKQGEIVSLDERGDDNKYLYEAVDKNPDPAAEVTQRDFEEKIASYLSDAKSPLTRYQKKILPKVLEGESQVDIAKSLDCTRQNVSVHVGQIRKSAKKYLSMQNDRDIQTMQNDRDIQR